MTVPARITPMPSILSCTPPLRNNPKNCELWRSEWANVCNAHLKTENHIDHRSYAPDLIASLISSTAFSRSEALIIRPLNPPRSHLLFLTVQVRQLLLQEPFPCAVILFQVFCVLSQNP